MDLKPIINKIKIDDFARPSGILAIYKTAGQSAHDVVAKVRKILDYKKVGHAGALDSFAIGIMLILVGKATKLSDQLINKNKSYRAKILLGMATDTQDIEGKILQTSTVSGKNMPQSHIQQTLAKFMGVSEQYVSSFSSVKVDGQKLRKLMRNPNYDHQIIQNETSRQILLTEKSSHKQFTVDIPKKQIEISKLNLIDYQSLIGLDQIKTYFNDNQSTHKIKEQAFAIVEVEISCSKGTYIRQFAEDFGAKLNLPAMLIELERIGLADLTITDTIKIEDLANLINRQYSPK